MGGNDSPERGVARDDGTDVLIMCGLLLDRLREGANPGELTADW